METFEDGVVAYGEGLTEEDFSEFDAIIEALRQEKPVVKRYVPNDKRISECRLAYSALRRCLNEAGCNIRLMDFEQSEIAPSSGDIIIEAEEIRFVGTKWFARIAELADNIDVYPLTDGAIRMTVGFYGLLDKAK